MTNAAPKKTESSEEPTGRGKEGRLPRGALILGLGTLIPIPLLSVALGVAAVAVGVVCLVQRRARRRLAIAGIVLGAGVPLVVWPAVALYLDWAHDYARQVVCASNLRGIAQALSEYASDSDGAFPAGLEALLTGDVVLEQSLRCPSSSGERELDYFYHAPRRDAPGSALIVCDLRDNHDGGRNAASLDGTVQWLTEQEFQQLLAQPENAEFARALEEAEGP
jgi:hypothetical protein